MPRPLPVPVREAIFRLWRRGQKPPEIAAALRLPDSTVYRLIDRFRRDGQAAIPPSYRRRADDVTPPDAVRAALDLRRAHPTWGAEMIRLQLRLVAPDRPVPAGRTLQRWFARDGLSPAPAGRRPRAETGRAAAPHDTWQMDAKEHINIKNSIQVSWLRMIDECSGAVVHTAVFPPRGLVPGRPRCRAGAA